MSSSFIQSLYRRIPPLMVASALAAVLILGARRGKYQEDGGIKPILGHSMPLATIGVFLMF